MPKIPSVINLPEPKDQKEADLFNSIRDYLYQVVDALTQNESDISAVTTHTQGTDTELGAQSEDLDMNTHKIVGVVDPTSDQEAATKKYVDDSVPVTHTQNTDTALGSQTEDLDMNTHKVVGVVDPVDDQDAATKKYVDDSVNFDYATENDIWKALIVAGFTGIFGEG